MKWIVTDEARLLTQALEQHPEKWRPLTRHTLEHLTEPVKICTIGMTEAKVGAAAVPLGIYGRHKVYKAARVLLDLKRDQERQKERDDTESLRVVVTRVALNVETPPEPKPAPNPTQIPMFTYTPVPTGHVLTSFPTGPMTFEEHEEWLRSINRREERGHNP